MAYELSWYHEQRVIYVRIWGDLTLDELRHYNTEVYDKLDHGVSPVHLILDVTDMKQFPPSLTALKSTAHYLSHPNLGRNVMIGGPMLAQSFARITAQLLKLDFRTTRTMREALSLLKDGDATLVAMEEHVK